MPMFRKKPVVVEARPMPSAHSLRGEHLIDQKSLLAALASWCRGQITNCAVDGVCILIDTLEGQMKALPGDWIIKGVNGEFYPCKPEIFAKTYEAAE